MPQSNPAYRISVVTVSLFIFSSLLFNQCKKICTEQRMLTLLKRQKVDFYPFVDSLKLEEDPQKYNPNYACLSLFKLNDHAPSVLWGFRYCWKTDKVDSIGCVEFHDFYELIGVSKSKAIIVTYANRERISFSLLTFENEGIEVSQTFLVLENELDNTYCLEIDYDSIQFEGDLVKGRLNLRVNYTYLSTCENVEGIKTEKAFKLQLSNPN
jgi:hypothetical protein